MHIGHPNFAINQNALTYPVNAIRQVGQTQQLIHVQENLDDHIPDLVQLIIDLQQIPSPTFEEALRANFIENQFIEIGLKNVEKDPINNVYARLPGKGRSGQSLVLTAHSDTVFSADTDLAIKKQDSILYGPGIGDNAAGVAAILTLAKIIKQNRLPTKSDIWFIANVCEEGMGNLRGMRAVVDRLGRNARYIVVEGGSLGQVIHKAIGVKRFRIAINTAGGHSWGSFGEPNAIHEISHIVSQISHLPVPGSPKTTFNVGRIEGGTTVNSIASSASILLDLRSEDEAILQQLITQVKSIVETRLSIIHQKNKNVTIEMEEVGHRPAGCISPQDDLVLMAEEALRSVGWSQVNIDSGSTDANIPLSMGIPSVCVGLTTSGNSHRLDEYIELSPLKLGLQHLLLLTLAASNY